MDQSISDIYNEIERFYNFDNQTTYVFTSTRGSYIADTSGDIFYLNPNTPYIIWGAGINKTSRMSFVPELRQYRSRVDIDQTSIAAIIATILNIPIPTNSMVRTENPIHERQDNKNPRYFTLNTLSLFT